MDKLVEKLVFGRSGLNSSVFEKLLISYSCISFMKYYALRSFLHKIALFFKNTFFLDFRSLESLSTDRNCDKNFGLNLLGSIGIQSMLNRPKLKNFQFLSFWPNFFFMHHLCSGFTCIALIFYIRLVVLQSYLSLFSHITCIHFAKLGTQLDLKIDWLIFELCTF